MQFHFGWRHSAGWIALSWGEKCLHLYVQKHHRQWGYSEDWYDGPFYLFGLGRWLLFVWR